MASTLRTLLLAITLTWALSARQALATEADPSADLWASAAPAPTVSDPLEGWNRLMFGVNDTLYFWALKPISTGYAAVLPLELRQGVHNVFDNLTQPVYFVNALLQGKGSQALTEAARFCINSTIGLLGFIDVAGETFAMTSNREDLGQTLGVYGVGDSPYLVWPLLGASTLRDTVGLVGDAFLQPINYGDIETWTRVGARSVEIVNDTSLRLGEYEDLKSAALDPYLSLRDGYLKLRSNQIAN
ncbi:MlaA family lipoprotein [Magnetofaba australis]|uniref:Putative VacJ family lipoprotein n=1 Tax=Magnetofaba australis IT-1 TaxID=1434232 RepID=A0A1Y2K2U6_9PROT|nr:VacJ family lipoprotein [Magnetofaba australis]OSM02358.1 putative VacJ family lipoprotein [Magnetofaba australis IT-1]